MGLDLLRLQTLKFDDQKMYAVTAGDYAGSFFIPIKHTGTAISCFQLPQQRIVNVPEKKFDWGIKEKVLEVVATLEDEYYNYIHELYRHEASNN